jgi:hypothetical protein
LPLITAGIDFFLEIVPAELATCLADGISSFLGLLSTIASNPPFVPSKLSPVSFTTVRIRKGKGGYVTRSGYAICLVAQKSFGGMRFFEGGNLCLRAFVVRMTLAKGG